MQFNTFIDWNDYDIHNEKNMNLARYFNHKMIGKEAQAPITDNIFIKSRKQSLASPIMEKIVHKETHGFYKVMRIQKYDDPGL